MENKHKQFKPYDKVLLRDNKGIWQINFYSYWNECNKSHSAMVYPHANDISDDDILPYEGNEHLVGTTNEPDEVIELKKGEWGFAGISLSDDPSDWLFRRYSWVEGGRTIICESRWQYSYFIRFSDFDPNNMKETIKHALYVKNGKIVRYKE